MDTIEYRTADKSAWGAGPWQDEPDKKQWRDEATDLACLIHRNDGGAWCGYVGVPPGHPFHGKDYDEVSVDAHGGLTFAAGCGHSADPSRGICHVPSPGEPDDVWWLGFDCSHLGDASPAYAAVCGSMGLSALGQGVYRDLAYVEREVRYLAAQIATIANAK